MRMIIKAVVRGASVISVCVVIFGLEYKNKKNLTYRFHNAFIPGNTRLQYIQSHGQLSGGM